MIDSDLIDNDSDDDDEIPSGCASMGSESTERTEFFGACSCHAQLRSLDDTDEGDRLCVLGALTRSSHGL